MKSNILVAVLICCLLLLSGCNNSNNNADTEIQEMNNQIEMSTLSGKVFLDENGNGRLDENEIGIQGVVIQANQLSATTNAEGNYSLAVVYGAETIQVDKTTLSSDLELTTNNERQTFEINENQVVAEAIGYRKKNNSENSGLSFFDTIDREATYDNYYFELLMSDGSGDTPSMKFWVIDGNIKSETQGMVIYSNRDNGTMGVYNHETNQVVVTPYMEMEDMVTPFTFMADLDPESFTSVMYKGEETLDGKDVLVFENSAGGIKATYYIWKEHKLIIKMETVMNDLIGGFYFKDLTFDSVTIEEISYPEGAEILDMGSM